MDIADSPLWLKLEQVHDYIRKGDGSGIKVAILDSGIEAGHPALVGLELTDDVIITSDGIRYSAESGDGCDVFGHGTAVASIIRRFAPRAEIGSFRVLGSNLDSRTALICEGAYQALERGYHILNCSFGCQFRQHALQYKAWVDAAYIRGVHVVAASNNPNSARFEWPAHFSSVLAVSTAANAKDLQAYHTAGMMVEFSANGTDVDVAWRGGASKKVSGSSFAAPHVTALLARILSGCPDLPPTQAKALLQQLAPPAPESIRSSQTRSNCG